MHGPDLEGFLSLPVSAMDEEASRCRVVNENVLRAQPVGVAVQHYTSPVLVKAHGMRPGQVLPRVVRLEVCLAVDEVSDSTRGWPAAPEEANAGVLQGGVGRHVAIGLAHVDYLGREGRKYDEPRTCVIEIMKIKCTC